MDDEFDWEALEAEMADEGVTSQALDVAAMKAEMVRETFGPEMAALLPVIGERWDQLVPVPAELDGLPVVALIAPGFQVPDDWEPGDEIDASNPPPDAIDDRGRLKVLPLALIPSGHAIDHLHANRLHFVGGTHE
jgi:hypothetical protein